MIYGIKNRLRRLLLEGPRCLSTYGTTFGRQKVPRGRFRSDRDFDTCLSAHFASRSDCMHPGTSVVLSTVGFPLFALRPHVSGDEQILAKGLNVEIVHSYFFG